MISYQSTMCAYTDQTFRTWSGVHGPENVKRVRRPLNDVRTVNLFGGIHWIKGLD